jgi:hypothetical protein
VQWFSFRATGDESHSTEPRYRNFTMADAQFSWDDDIDNPAVWIDDPWGAPSQHPSASSDPSHVSASVESSTDDKTPSAPSTDEEGHNEDTSTDGSVESGRAKRGRDDDTWRFPNGAWHPRNLYNDPKTDDDYSASHPSA